MNDHDKSQLVSFVTATETELKRAMRYLPEGELTEDDRDVAELADQAWKDLRKPNEFARVRRAINSGLFDDRLDAHSLSGPQLTFKLGVVSVARRAVDEAEREGDEPREPPTERNPIVPWRRGRDGPVRRAIRKLLGAIDVVLDSLVSALAGIGSPLKEFKEALEKWLED